MSVTVNNKFGVMLAEKRAQEKRNIPLAEVSEGTGIPPKTLMAWANNTVTRFDVHVIDAICQYFGVKPGDLFEYLEDEMPPPPKKKK